MSAIITNTFRRQSCQRFLNDIIDVNNNYYIGLGKSDPWSDDENANPVPLPNGSVLESQDVQDNLISLVRLKTQATLFPKNRWRSGRTYKVYDPTDPLLFDLQSDITTYYPSVMTHNDRVYACLSNVSNGASTTPPSGTTYGIEVTADGYVWTYIQDVDIDSAFYSDEFVPVATTPESDTGQLNATGGALYNFAVLNGGFGLDGSEKLMLSCIDSNGVEIVNSNLNTDARFAVTRSSGSITDISYVDIASDLIKGVHKASVIVYNSTQDTILDYVVIKPMVAKAAGFGSNPTEELPSYYAGCFSKFQGPVDGEALTGVPFRQVSLIKNPASVDNGDDDVFYEDDEALDATKYVQIVQDGVTQNFLSGAIIEQAGTGARAIVDKTDMDNDRIYYHRNSDNNVNYIAFNNSDDITITSLDGEVTQVFPDSDISSILVSEYTHNTGEVVFIDNRAKITRNADQTEDVKIVIQF